MLAQIRSELLKLVTVRTSLFFALAAAGFVALVLTIQAATAGGEFMGPLSDAATQRALFLTAGAAPLIAIVFGCLGVTSELRHHTIVSTLLVDASRIRVITAKTIATLLAGAGLGAIAVAVSIVGTGLILLVTGTSLSVEIVDVVAAGAGTIGGAALGAVFGLGIGGVVRNQALAVGAVLILMLAIEPLVTSLLPDVGPWLPSALVTVLAEAQTGGPIGLAAAAITLAGYALVTTVGAALTLQHADVT